MTADLKPYPELRDSGVRWLGKVPALWGVRRLKSVCSESGLYGANVSAGAYVEHGVRFLRTTDITEDGKLKACGVFLPEELAQDHILADGDVLISRSGTVGRSFLYSRESHGPCSYAGYLVRFVPNASVVSKYLFYFTKTPAFSEFSRAMAISSTIENLNADKYSRLPLPLPPLVEQDAIVRFLDHVDDRIQRYICAKEKLIALLEEQKQAVIHQAVTGQIDVRTGEPYPAYKDSGMEWLGEVPAHWGRCRLRNVVSEVTTGSRGWSSFASEVGPLFIRIANLRRGSLQLRFDDVVRLRLPETSEKLRTRVKAGDVLVSVTAYIGSVAIAPADVGEAYVSQHVARCRPHSEILSEWLGYILLSKLGQVHGQMSLYGGTKDGLSLDDVKNYPVLLPPRSEQVCILDWLEERLQSLEAAGAAMRRQIELIGKYRACLISNVVTGKFDVRGAVDVHLGANHVVSHNHDRFPVGHRSHSARAAIGHPEDVA